MDFRVQVTVFVLCFVLVLEVGAGDEVSSLKQLVEKQAEILITLGKRIQELEKEVSKEKTINELQSLKIDILNEKLLGLDKQTQSVAKYKDDNPSHVNNYRSRANSTSNNNGSSTRRVDGGEFIRSDAYWKENLQKRLLIPATSNPKPPVVAFSAYMSKNEDNVGVHHILTFDKVLTNIGNGYNGFTGSFVAPQAGVYVLTYTIVTLSYSMVCTDLIVNNDVAGHAYGYSGNLNVQLSPTATVVVQLNLGDTVYVRTESSGSCAEINAIYGDAWRRSTFSGWLVG